MKKFITTSKAYLRLIKDWFYLDPKKKELFKSRYEVCQSCPYKDDDIDWCSVSDESLKTMIKVKGCPKKYW